MNRIATGDPVLSAHGIERNFRSGDGSELRVLRGVELEVGKGEAVAVVGASGAGKSTLLQVLGGLDRPDAGEIRVGGASVGGLDPDALARFRNERIGFVFQFHHLLREFSALENVMMPLLIAGRSPAEANARAEAGLRQVGLQHRLDHRPWQLSGGEQQRVAVARALANDPAILLADEPSGNLDEGSGAALHDLLFRLRDERELSMVLVTHNRDLARRADRILQLREGALVASPGLRAAETSGGEPRGGGSGDEV